ncbi:hypothetical protein BJX66DRAFT_222985 [Aspergillus keveii]|uniref:Uncharacterized protein n=1 Tax=Aspergillus keveii TaxID=714993 RepID=A0ABR4G3G8_9EURO
MHLCTFFSFVSLIMTSCYPYLFSFPFLNHAPLYRGFYGTDFLGPVFFGPPLMLGRCALLYAYRAVYLYVHGVGR